MVKIKTINHASVRIRLYAAWQCLKANSLLLIVDGVDVAQEVFPEHAKATAGVAGAYTDIYAHRMGVKDVRRLINRKKHQLIEEEEIEDNE